MSVLFSSKSENIFNVLLINFFIFISIVKSIGYNSLLFLIFGLHLCNNKATILKLFCLHAQCNAVPNLGIYKSKLVFLKFSNILAIFRFPLYAHKCNGDHPLDDIKFTSALYL